jgi:hypothetical protein
MNSKQRRAYFKQFDRKRGAYLAWARRIYRSAFRAQYRKWAELGELDANLLDPEPMRRAYDRVWSRVGQEFAVETARQIESGRKSITATRNDYRDSLLNYLATAGANRVQGVNDTTIAKLQSILDNAVRQGLSIADTYRLIGADFSAMAGYRSERIARTEIIGASNRGAYEAGRATGIALNKMWIATVDDRTRDSHRELDGVTIPMNDNFVLIDEGGDVLELTAPGQLDMPMNQFINCFTGDNTVSFEGIKRSIKSRFKGYIYTIKTAGGNQFTATGNHPIMTNAGFVMVDKLKYGSQLAKGSFEVGFGSDFNVNNAPTTFEQVHNTLAVRRGAMRVSGINVNLYGNAFIADDTNIEVINSDLHLWYNIKPKKINFFDKLLFKKTLLRTVSLLRNGLFYSLLVMERFWHTSNSFVRRLNLSRFLLIGHLRPFEKFGFASVSDFNTSLNQPVTDNIPATSESFSNKFFAFTRFVQPNGIVDVDFGSFKPREFDTVVHIDKNYVDAIDVYTIETTNGIYSVNGIIAKNCRCTIAFIPTDSQPF